MKTLVKPCQMHEQAYLDPLAGQQILQCLQGYCDEVYKERRAHIASLAEAFQECALRLSRISLLSKRQAMLLGWDVCGKQEAAL